MLDQAQILKNYIQGHKKDEVPEEQKDEEKAEVKTKSARILSVTSGKGGVGKSNFTVNFALELAKKGHRVLIVDADFGLSNIDVILGIVPQYDLSYVVRKEKTLAEVITEGPEGIKFISGGSGVADLLSLGSEDIENVLGALEELDNLADTVIFDTGAGINDNNIQLISASDEVVLVTTPEPPAIVDAYALAKTLFNTNNQAKIRLVINKAESKDEAERIANNFLNVSRNYLNANIEELGYITEDSAVVKAVKSQKPFTMSFPDSKAAQNVVNIAERFLELPESPSNNGGFKSFIRKMLKR